MTRASLRPYLRQVPIFRVLPANMQLSIAGRLVKTELAVTETLDLRGDRADVLCIVVEGKVQVETWLPSGRTVRSRLMAGQWTGQPRVAGWQPATRVTLAANRGRATVLLLWRHDLMDLAGFRLLAGLAGALRLAVGALLSLLRFLGSRAARYPMAAGILIALLCFAAYLFLTNPGKRLQADWLYLTLRDQARLTGQERAERLGHILCLVPDHPYARVEMGNLALQADDPAGARQHYETVAQRHGAAANNLAVLQLSQGDAAAALGSLTLSTQLEPEVAIAHQNLGLAYRQLGQPVEATRALKEALRLDPTLLAARYHLGMDSLSQGATIAAGAAFERMLEQDPSSAPAYWGLGLVYMEIGDLRRAVESLKEAERLAPGSLTAEFYLGWCQAQVGNRVQARTTWTDLLAHSPPQELADRVGVLLAEAEDKETEEGPMDSAP